MHAKPAPEFNQGGVKIHMKIHCLWATFELIRGKLIAGDSTRLRAQNSKKNNFNQARIYRHIACSDE